MSCDACAKGQFQFSRSQRTHMFRINFNIYIFLNKPKDAPSSTMCAHVIDAFVCRSFGRTIQRLSASHIQISYEIYETETRDGNR